MNPNIGSECEFLLRWLAAAFQAMASNRGSPDINCPLRAVISEAVRIVLSAEPFPAADPAHHADAGMAARRLFAPFPPAAFLKNLR